MLRALALLSIKSDVVELLEIGTLCGISAGSLHRIGARAQRIVRLTLIDPLAGYYETSINDGQTGVPITRDVVVRNMGELGVDPSNYRIIQRLSTDPEAVAEASDREYDFVMVDGDHSLQGVASDFELYGRLVSRGGLLIFDDYDTSDWPAIKSYVDEHVRPMGEWLWIGGDWRTAILRRKLDPAST
jgi:predicted O-methyltransferase YrrM